MQFTPLLGFYFRHGSQIEKLVDSGSTGASHTLVELLQNNAAFIKKCWPELNENNLFDDALETLKAVTAPAPPSNYPDPAQS